MSASKRIAAVLVVLTSAGLAFFWYDFVGKRERGLSAMVPAVLSEKILNAENPVLTTHFEGTFGRLRTVVAGPRGLLAIHEG